MTIQIVPSDNTFAAPANNPTVALAASLIAKASAGILYGVDIFNSTASAQTIQLHDSATLPADTAVPVAVLNLPASGSLQIDYGVHGKAFGLGIVICNSTTVATKTIGSATLFIAPRFK